MEKIKIFYENHKVGTKVITKLHFDRPIFRVGSDIKYTLQCSTNNLNGVIRFDVDDAYTASVQIAQAFEPKVVIMYIYQVWASTIEGKDEVMIRPLLERHLT